MAGSMPRIGPDPFDWAKDYNRQMTALGQQGEQNAQNALMNVFAQEAARQRSWSDLPVDLAKQNNTFRNSVALAGINAGYKQQAADAKAMNLPTGDIARYIDRTATALGEDPDAALAIAAYESGLRPGAVSPTGASGVFQFTQGTGKQYGLVGNGVDKRRDPKANIEAGIRLMKDNKEQLARLGVTIPSDPRDAVRFMYMAHNQGAGGASRLLRAYEADPNAPADRYADVNNLRVNGWRPGMSVKAFVDMHTGRVVAYYDQYKKQRAAKRGGTNNTQFVFGGKIMDLNDPDDADTTTDTEDDDDAS